MIKGKHICAALVMLLVIWGGVRFNNMRERVAESKAEPTTFTVHGNLTGTLCKYVITITYSDGVFYSRTVTTADNGFRHEAVLEWKDELNLYMFFHGITMPDLLEGSFRKTLGTLSGEEND